MPDFPSSSAFQNAGAPNPKGETAPNPVMTTRRMHASENSHENKRRIVGNRVDENKRLRFFNVLQSLLSAHCSAPPPPQQQRHSDRQRRKARRLGRLQGHKAFQSIREFKVAVADR